MRYTLFILMFLSAEVLFGQQKDEISMITIDFFKGHSSWGNPGVYSVHEVFNFSPLNNHQFKLTKYLRINRTAGNDGKTFTNDTLKLSANNFGSRNIAKHNIDSLISKLNHNEDNFTPEFIKPKLQTPDKKTIIAIGKRLDKEFLLQEDSDKIDPVVIQRIQAFDQVDKFIKINKPDTNLIKVVSDAWNSCSIQVVYKKNHSVKYDCSFFQLFGQPFYRFDKSGDHPQINLLINTMISDLLPKSSSLKKEIEINSLTNKYIEWYINNVL